MTGVAGGLAATLGILNPDHDTLVQMGSAVGLGSLIGLGIASKIKACFLDSPVCESPLPKAVTNMFDYRCQIFHSSSPHSIRS